MLLGDIKKTVATDFQIFTFWSHTKKKIVFLMNVHVLYVLESKSAKKIRLSVCLYVCPVRMHKNFWRS